MSTTFRFSACAALFLASSAAAHGAEVSAKNQEPSPSMACGVCHVSNNPTEGAAELKTCPQPKAAAPHSVSEGPDVVVIDRLSELYEPVLFLHRLHASMSDMGNGCAMCHHRNPPGPILPCRDCHGGPSNPVNLNQPGLKGAYHRQCLGCHREWTHQTDCVVCHAKRMPGRPLAPHSDPTDIMGRPHPHIQVPEVWTYETKEVDSGQVVVFHHKQHTESYGQKCVNCHRQESCSRCHDVKAHARRIREDPHQDCMRCHEKELTDNCAYCHTETPRKSFEHKSAPGLALVRYHKEVKCRQCHPGEGRFTTPERACASCHAADWTPKVFDHALTGQPLDETHTQITCPDCHTAGLGKPATCKTCHEDGRTAFPKESKPAPAPKPG